MMRLITKFSYFLVLIFSSIHVLAILPAPKLRCASVVAGGNVALTWEVVTDATNSFNSYHIYYSNNLTGPYTEISTNITNINQTTYTDLLANANNQKYYYYMKTLSGTTDYSESSDTLCTILLDIKNLGTGTVQLSWDPLHNPSTLGTYTVYREYPAGNWVNLGTTKNLFYTDMFTLCNAMINYYVDFEESFPCTSRSSVKTEHLQDITAPVKPAIDSVSVDSLSGYSVIGWKPSPSTDTEGYIIYENIKGVWGPIDTIHGRNNTFFVNNHPLWSNSDSASLSYCIAAFDSCLNTSPISINQNTIHLKTQLDTCSRNVTLTWNSYLNMQNGLRGYKIFASENNGPFQLLNINSSANRSYVHSSLNPFSYYKYVIQAFDSSKTITSSSNANTIYTYVPDSPKFLYLRQATIKDFNHVQLKCHVDVSAYASSYKVMRSDSIDGTYAQIGSASPNGTSTIMFDDFSANVNQQSYFYKFIAVDSCGNESITSNHGHTIYLTAEPFNDIQNLLKWNDYSDWLGSVKSYNIYRKVNNFWETSPIASLPAGTITYTDNISSFLNINTEGKFGYLIEALEDNGNPYSFTDTSFSNESYALQNPHFYVPNAFIPNGVNNIFIPVSVFIDAADYSFTVYNRWGQMIFETTDSRQGWDGKFNGNPCPQDVYAYLIRYKNSQGNYIEKSGTITLIR